ncbi:SusC/RagA family TonB-linked outer membrane protein [Galbibacter pacificus]|uniref:TonB-dependent receptor n=1 Tax=Galbibacter pacificus TaxID=2996052 RepID=A0ABT6FN19_9FLAO|nr:TonB-dependent receptor [Galbibacter pacificus]MDG3581127.1 TonB-dependent receptor [Galbibacter pacificus]MDG3584605.1 TonB-dependent receptor [Galbibacter pacificus]
MYSKINEFLIKYGGRIVLGIMKTFIFFCCFITFAFNPKEGYSQNAKIVINSDSELSIEEIFGLIKRQTDYTFIYRSDLFEDFPKVQLEKGIIKAGDLLEKSLAGEGFTYSFTKEGTILLEKKSVKTLKTLQQSVSGTVYDNEGYPLPGATVSVKNNEGIGTQTDFNGVYSLEINDLENTVLVFRYLGFRTLEVPLDGKSTLDVTLEEDAQSLDEIVVVGYGKQKKVSMTSAVSSISSDELVERPTKNLSAGLQGLAPGLTVIDRGGSPGSSDVNMYIRGVTTLGNNNPLVIIDGIEMNINDVDPNNVESISVLKDAASTAIYGSRGANGVILITTKRGKKGKFAVNYNQTLDMQNLTVEPEHMETEAYLRLQNTAYQNRGSDPLYSEEEIQKYVDGSDRLRYPLPNEFFDAVIQDDAPMQRHALSIAGGTEILRTNVMLNYFDQDGIYPNQNLKRYRVRVNNDINLSEKLLVSADVSLAKKDRHTFRDQDNVYHRMLHSSQFTVPRFPDGTYGLSKQRHNPLAWTDTNIVGATDATTYNGLVNLKATWDIVPGLSFSSQYAVDLSDYSSVTNIPTYEIRDYFNPDVVLKNNEVNQLTEYRSQSLQKTWNNTLTYNLVLGKHDMSALAGYSEISYDYKELESNGRNFYNDDLRDLSLSDPLNREINSLYTDWGLRSLFGRLNYSFDEKYILEFNMRYDGSSRFPENNRYTFFPSVAGAWRISKEPFWNSVKSVINEFKIRASWGETGNQNVGLYTYYDNLNLANYYVFNGVPVTGVRQTDFASQDLTWETTTQTDIGFDMSFFQNKINIALDWFKKETEGILLELPIPGIVGLNPSATNAGSVENKGWELQVNYQNAVGDFRYSITGNISDVKNKITDLAGTGPYYANEQDMFIRKEGESIDALFGYVTDGLLTQEDIDNDYPTYASDATAGDIKYLDISGPDGVPDGMITADDRKVIGSSIPRLTYSSVINLGWKNFDFNLQLQGVGNKDIMLYGALVEAGSWEGFTIDIAEDYWTPDNLDARFPRPQKQNNKNSRPSDWWMVNGAYLRVKNLQFGYSLPTDVIKKFGVSRLRLFVGGTNLWTISDLNEWGLDAEAATGRGVFYPATKTYTLGLNVGF